MCSLRTLVVGSVVLVGCGGQTFPTDPHGNGQVQAAAVACAGTSVEGVDVSRINGTIDFAQVKAAGVLFAFIKVTQGDYATQQVFYTHWPNAKAAGVLRSAY